VKTKRDAAKTWRSRAQGRRRFPAFTANLENYRGCGKCGKCGQSRRDWDTFRRRATSHTACLRVVHQHLSAAPSSAIEVCEALTALDETLPDWRRAAGRKGEADPIRHFVITAGARWSKLESGRGLLFLTRGVAPSPSRAA